jgi:hypothetical protein
LPISNPNNTARDSDNRKAKAIFFLYGKVIGIVSNTIYTYKLSTTSKKLTIMNRVFSNNNNLKGDAIYECQNL